MRKITIVSTGLGFLAGIGLPYLTSIHTENQRDSLNHAIAQNIKLPDAAGSVSSSLKELLTPEWRVCLILGLPVPTRGDAADRMRTLAAANPVKFLQVLSEMNNIPPWSAEFQEVVRKLNLPSPEGEAIWRNISRPEIRNAVLLTAVEQAAGDGDYTRAAAVFELHDDVKNRSFTMKLSDLLVKGDPGTVAQALYTLPGSKANLAVFLYQLAKHDFEAAERIIAGLPQDSWTVRDARFHQLQMGYRKHPELMSLDRTAESLSGSTGPNMSWLRGAVRPAAENDPAGTLSWITARPNGVERNSLLESVAEIVVNKAPDQFERVMRSATSRSVQKSIAKAGASALIESKGLEAGYGWADSFADPELRSIAGSQFVKSGWKKGPNEMITLTAAEAAKNPTGAQWQTLIEATGLPRDIAIDPKNPPERLKGISKSNLELLSAAIQKSG